MGHTIAHRFILSTLSKHSQCKKCRTVKKDVTKKLTHSRDSGRGGESKVMGLEKEVHIRAERDSFTVREGEEVVVIEDGIEGLDPL